MAPLVGIRLWRRFATYFALMLVWSETGMEGLAVDHPDLSSGRASSTSWARWLPGRESSCSRFTQKFLRKGEIQKLEIAARQIGNAHQFVERATRYARPGSSIEHPPLTLVRSQRTETILKALWERGGSTFSRKTIRPPMRSSPSWWRSIRATSSATSPCCMARRSQPLAGRRQPATTWRDTSNGGDTLRALYVLAQLYFSDNCLDEAREHLQALIMDVDSSPKAIARKQMSWKSRAQKLLKRIPS